MTQINRILMASLPVLILALLIQRVQSLAKPVLTTRREALLTSATSLVAITTSPTIASGAYLDPSLQKVTDRVYLDVEFGTNNKGRIVMGLFGETMPRVTQNFVSLCKTNQYAGTTFYRVISGITVQGGGIGDNTGKTGKSSLENNQPFEPDNYDIQHSQEGLVSMARSLDGSVDSRFFINTKEDAGWADDRYAAFGIVQEGMDLVHEMEQQKVKPPQNSPVEPIRIVASGVL